MMGRSKSTDKVRRAMAMVHPNAAAIDIEFVCFFARFARKNALISCDTQVMYQHERKML